MIEAKTIKPGTYCALYHFRSNKQIINGLFSRGREERRKGYHFYQLFDKVCWLDEIVLYVFVINNSIWPERLTDLREMPTIITNWFLVWLYFGTQAELKVSWIQNELMRSFFPRFQPQIWSISALPSNKLPGQKSFKSYLLSSQQFYFDVHYILVYSS